MIFSRKDLNSRKFVPIFILLSSLTLLSSLRAVSEEPSSQPSAPAPFVRGVPFDAGIQPDVRVWGNGEYLCWWMKNSPLPAAIATSGRSSDLAPAALGQPGTEVLFGNGSIDNGALSGFRASVRSWIGEKNTYAIEASGFYLPEKTDTVFSKQSSAVLGVPFNNVAPFPLPPDHGGWTLAGPGETALPLAYDPVGFIGSITAKSSIQLWGVELNGLFHFFSLPTFRLSALGGACYTDLSEHLNFNFYTTMSPEDLFLMTVMKDRFGTHNEIYAGQLGLRGEWSSGWLFVSFLAKIGLGGNIQTARIKGSFIDPVSNLYFNYGAGQSGGIFAQSTNGGSHSQVRFEAIPSAILRFGLNLLRGLRISLGYDILFLSNVLRPGDQIDSTLNETQAGPASGGVPTLSGPARPKVLMDTTNYWAQGINAGIEARF